MKRKLISVIVAMIVALGVDELIARQIESNILFMSTIHLRFFALMIVGAFVYGFTQTLLEKIGESL